MQIGSRIYYELATGNVLVKTLELSGLVYPTTIDQDVSSYKELSERNRDTFDYLELDYGQYKQDFAECISYRVVPETRKLEFKYPDPENPDEPQPYQPPLSEQIGTNTEYLVDVDFRLSMVELGLA